LLLKIGPTSLLAGLSTVFFTLPWRARPSPPICLNIFHGRIVLSIVSVLLVIESKRGFLCRFARSSGRLPLGVSASWTIRSAAEWSIMRLKRGQVWRCINVACGAEIQVVGDAGPEDGSNPRCTCGSIMKMHYTKPQFGRAETPPQGVKPHMERPSELRSS